MPEMFVRVCVPRTPWNLQNEGARGRKIRAKTVARNFFITPNAAIPKEIRATNCGADFSPSSPSTVQFPYGFVCTPSPEWLDELAVRGAAG